MTLQFAKATKTKSRLRLALVGPSGSGKTYTALKVATELGGKIALLDTERGSACKYADEFEFDTADLTQHGPQDYLAAIMSAEKAGYNVFIIDSLSHAWDGVCGALEQVDMATKRSRSKNSFNAWGEVTPHHRRMLEGITSSGMHVIATMRTKVAYVIEKDERGRQTPRKVGMAPVQRDGVEYEFDVVGEMDWEHRLMVTKSRCRAVSDAVIEKPGQEFGASLKAWLEDGVEPTEAPKPAQNGQAKAQPQGVQDAIAQVSQKFNGKAEADPLTECREAMKAEVLDAFGKWSEARELVEEAIGRWPGKEDPPTLDECQRIREAVQAHKDLTTGNDLDAGSDDLLAGEDA